MGKRPATIALLAVLGVSLCGQSSTSSCVAEPPSCSTNLWRDELPSGRIVFPGGRVGRGTVLYATDPAGSELLEVVPAGSLGGSVEDVSDDGSRLLLLVTFPGPSLRVRDAWATNDVAFVPEAYGGRLSPDGDHLVYWKGDGVWILSLAANGDPAPIQIAASGQSASWSADATRIVFVNPGPVVYPLTLQTHHLPTGQTFSLSAPSGWLRQPAYHPQNLWIVFGEYEGGTNTIRLTSPEGLFEIPTGLVGEDPSFSPDGTQLLYHRDGRPWIAALDGSNAHPIPLPFSDLHVSGPLRWLGARAP